MKDLLNKTVIHGTQQPEHLIPTLIKFLDLVKEKLSFEKRESFVATWTAIDNFLAVVENQENYLTSDQAVEDLETILSWLNELAPDGFYFGPHIGDGSDFGYWAVEEDNQNG